MLSRLFGAIVAAAAALAIARCGGAPTGPTPPVDTPPNTPPRVTSVTLGGQRIEADDQTSATAVVEDAETPVDQLTYDWSAAPASGTFTGIGRQVKWQAPRQQTTPALYTVTLTVTETYTAGGQVKQNKASGSAQIHYNDSGAEIRKISMRFLTELFPTYSVTPAEAVQDFTDSCKGKSDELSDITGNRKNFQIYSGVYTINSIDVHPDRLHADVTGICEFHDIPTDPSNPNYGRKEKITGTCALTTVYENWRWYLCESHFLQPASITLESLRYRVPGQIVPPDWLLRRSPR